MQNWKESLIVLAIIGAAVAIGRALAQDEPPKLRVILGRVIVSSVLCMAASTVLLAYPDAPVFAVVGVGCALGVAGEQALESVLARFAARRSA